MDNTTVVQRISKQGTSQSFLLQGTIEEILLLAHDSLKVSAKYLQDVYKWMDALSMSMSLSSAATTQCFISSRSLHQQMQCSPFGVHVFNERLPSTWYRCHLCRLEPVEQTLPLPSKKLMFTISSEAGSFLGFSDSESSVLEGKTFLSPSYFNDAQTQSHIHSTYSLTLISHKKPEHLVMGISHLEFLFSVYQHQYENLIAKALPPCIRSSTGHQYLLIWWAFEEFVERPRSHHLIGHMPSLPCFTFPKLWYGY